MKILLLEHPRRFTPERCNDIANTPLSSCLLTGYAAGMLQSQGHAVEIVEGYLDKLSYEELATRVRAMAPDILGIHMIYHWQNDSDLFAFLQKMKIESPAIYTAAYGFYATIAAVDILQSCAALDAAVIGEPEITFANLAVAVAVGNLYPDLPGLAFRDSAGGVQQQKPAPVADLDRLPFPVRTEAMYRLPEVNLLGSRGCYGRCIFCYMHAFYGAGEAWRGRSPENIAAEIDAVMAARGTRDFYFTDPNFFGPGRQGQERARQIAALLQPKDIRFGIEGRVNDIHDETIAALVGAGLRHILIGLESGNDASLKRMNKMTTVAQNERALRILRAHGVEPNVGFIMFEPDSTLADIRINFEFLQRNDLLKNLPVTVNVLYHQQIILAGTEAYQRLKSDNRFALTPASDYEGAVHFQTPAVAALADYLRQITHALFEMMDGIWSGKVAEPPGMQERSGRLNDLLVRTFADSLCALEQGEPLEKGGAATFIEKMKLRWHEPLST